MAKAISNERKKQLKSGMTKKSESFFDRYIKGDKFKTKKAPASNVDSGRGGKDSYRQKMMDKASMFAKKAATRDEAKVKSSDRTFKSTFDAATKAGKSTFTYGGKSYMTNKGKAENKDKMKVRIAEKGSIKKPAKKLDADTVKSYKKRIKYMKDRKAKGKNYSAKNLKELEAKLAANQ
jgi:hypothetical protein